MFFSIRLIYVASVYCMVSKEEQSCEQQQESGGSYG